MTPIPEFNEVGTLPPGDFPATLEEIRASILVVGPSGPTTRPDWDSLWREQLVQNLGELVRQLWRVGITEVFVDGSFTEDKDHPNDIDGYFECSLAHLGSGELQRELNQLDPHGVWTWDPAARRPYHGYPKRQLPMWHQYRVELYPHVRGLPSGIRDARGNELEFPAAFRQSRRDGTERGIVKLVPGASP